MDHWLDIEERLMQLYPNFMFDEDGKSLMCSIIYCAHAFESADFDVKLDKTEKENRHD